MDIVIIKDELTSANEFKGLIESLVVGVRVSRILHSIDEAVTWFQGNSPPDLIFADINLADGLSFEIVKSTGIKTPVVFCASNNDYALHAFENNGIDFLLKPISREKLLRALQKLRNLSETLGKSYNDYTFRLFIPDEQLEKTSKDTLLVYFKDRIIPIKIGKVDVLRSINNIVYLYTGNKKYEVRDTLDNLTALLDPEQFYRANRQFIIQRKTVVRVEHLYARKLGIHLAIGMDEIVVSKAKASSFLKWLGNV